jgi:hypothetical protein
MFPEKDLIYSKNARTETELIWLMEMLFLIFLKWRLFTGSDDCTKDSARILCNTDVSETEIST